MRKKLFITFISVLITIASFSQTQYEVTPDPKHPDAKILKGIINKDLVKNDTSYKWYSESQKSYAASDTAIIGALQRNNTVNYIVFGGTWCDDTRYVLPKFFMLQEKAGIADSRISFFGVDRQKQTLGNLAAALNITNVPTIIVMKNGKEVGRVVEYGKTGKWDKELAEIVAQ